MLNNTLERLRAMKMSAFADELARQMEDTESYGQLGFEDRLSLLVDSEWNRRQDNKFVRFIRNAHFSDASATMEGIEYIEDRHLDKGKMLRFATCRYVDEGRHIILKGASGNGNTFVYIDPPYRPLTATASFTSYSENEFGDKQQIELGKFVDKISAKGAKVVVSNSDPKNSDESDSFFDDLYSSYTIMRVSAKRMINSKATGRGSVNELLICNC